jgi:NitT/TauT family transport system permease protein
MAGVVSMTTTSDREVLSGREGKIFKGKRPTGRRRSSTSTRTVIRSIAAPLVTFALLGLGWEYVADHFESILPPLGDLWHQATVHPTFYLSQLWQTLQSAGYGFALGVSSAIIVAILMVHVPVLRSALLPVAVVLNGIPIIAVAPALIVAFGFGRLPHVIVVTAVAFFPMLINALTGLRAVDQQSLDICHSLSATWFDILIHLRLPSSLPFILAAAKTCITISVLGAVVSEFTGTTSGIGAVIVQATTYLNLPQLWTAIFTTALAALVLLGAVSLLERVLIRW